MLETKTLESYACANSTYGGWVKSDGLGADFDQVISWWATFLRASWIKHALVPRCHCTKRWLLADCRKEDIDKDSNNSLLASDNRARETLKSLGQLLKKPQSGNEPTNRQTTFDCSK